MPSRARLATWGLVALLAVDVALVGLAFRNPFRQPAAPVAPTSTAVPIVTATATGSTAPTAANATTSTTATTVTNTPSREAVSMVGVVPVDSTVAWRFVQGACPGGGASVQRTGDGGRTWATLEPPFAVIVRVSASDGSKASIVGAQDTCRESVKRTTDAGQTWGAGGQLAMWHLSVSTPGQVVNASGRASTPCGAAGPLSVASLSTTAAAVLCTTGKVMETANGGSDWVEIGRGLSAVALDVRLEAGKLTALVAHPADGCAGLAVSAVTGGTVTRNGCVDLGGRATDALQRRVALGFAGDAGWLVIDDQTFRSDDAGRTWASP